IDGDPGGAVLHEERVLPARENRHDADDLHRMRALVFGQGSHLLRGGQHLGRCGKRQGECDQNAHTTWWIAGLGWPMVTPGTAARHGRLSIETGDSLS